MSNKFRPKLNRNNIKNSFIKYKYLNYNDMQK